MAAELATTTEQKPAAVAVTGRPKIYLEGLQEEHQQRQLLMQYVQANMIEGTDYGTIPGTSNKTLLKPGAEKLTDLFRCVPEYEIVERIEDWDKPMFHYLFRCRIISRDTGSIVAEGFGSCNSRESKYRYRNGERKCPECGKPSIKKSKFPPRDAPNDPPGFYCYDKAGGCGAQFDHDDADITQQIVGKVENPDVADAANTILKMSKKRAQVDAVIALARCSEMFTQDVEDFIDHERDNAPKPAQQQQQKPQPTPPTFAEVTGWLLSANNLDELKSAWSRIHSKNYTESQVASLITMRDRRKADLAQKPAPQSTTTREPGEDGPDNDADIPY